jgi:hypothetical protein
MRFSLGLKVVVGEHSLCWVEETASAPAVDDVHLNVALGSGVARPLFSTTTNARHRPAPLFRFVSESTLFHTSLKRWSRRLPAHPGLGFCLAAFLRLLYCPPVERTVGQSTFCFVDALW